MKPLFTIHAGEYLAGSCIERQFPQCRVWLPSRDTGIDLPVTNGDCSRTVSLQVKFSKDFAPTHLSDFYRNKLRVCTWFQLKADALRNSRADYWVLVLQSFAYAKASFIVIKPDTLYSRIAAYHGRKQIYNLYFWINSAHRCWETRKMREPERRKVADNSLVKTEKDFSKYLDDWSSLERLSR